MMETAVINQAGESWLAQTAGSTAIARSAAEGRLKWIFQAIIAALSGAIVRTAPAAASRANAATAAAI